MSKAFTKEDVTDEPMVIRRRTPLPEGTPNYVTARGFQTLRDALAAAKPGPRRVELEQQLGTAVVVAPPHDRAEVRFGARTTLRDGAGRTRQVQLVGVDEADPGAGRIAFVAPLARALLGRRVGDAVTVRVPRGDEELEIVAVSYDDA